MMDELRPGPFMSGCLMWAKLPREVPDRTDCESETPVMLGSEVRVEAAMGFGDGSEARELSDSASGRPLAGL